ncbi:extracellular solute-binding protein [Cohnella algarum]|uniref:extracellular solute-binding protein n=1 Tax=Cohnella algarum TaxID=2044859 RepID=UPI00196760DA|nr:extracellular solute-binding protein [Cohnella algarum]MBN2982470.1 extracellular solute-binding protein [Cohnella algarum]
MKRYVKKSLATIGMIALTFAAACANGNDAAESPSPGAGESQPASAAETAAGPLSKYEPAIAVRTVMNDVGKDYLAQGETLEDNVWTRGYANELGIDLTFDWIVERANSGQKMNVTLASGDLPDIFSVNQTQYKQLLDAGKIADLTEAFDKYGSERLKEFYNMGGDGLKPVRQDGKLYGLTDYSGYLDNVPMVFVRSDWMEKLGLKPPETMDDLLGIAKAFAENDPDGNGQKDTYGIQLNKDLDSGWTIKLNGFANAYHALPGQWIDDGSGNLVYGSIRPEMKTALASMQELYKSGIVDPEFGTKDVNKAAESLMAGKAGIFFGPLSSPFVITAMMSNADADWMAYPIPSADGRPANVPSQIQNSTVYVVRHDFAHPEALVKMLNFAVEKLYGESAEAEAAAYLGPSGQGFQVTPIKILQPNKNIAIYQNVVKALESGDTGGLNREEKSNYDFIQQFRSGDRAQWVYERIFGPESTLAVVQHYLDNDLLTLNQFSAPPTATMATKKATLDKLELETFTKIIYGESPIDEFDKFVSDWKKLGGDQITAEVNEVAKAE